MPQTCSVCRHPDRQAIDVALVSGRPLRDVAGQHGLSKSAVERHGNDHLPATMVKAAEAKHVLDADELLQQAQGLYARAVALLQRADAEHDIKTALAGIGQARSCLELLMEAAGRIDRTPTINLLIDPQFVAITTTLTTALEPYPEARAAAARALLAIEAGYARD